MKFWKLTSAVIPLVLSTNVNAALIERLGGLAYYDDVANLTWLADADAAGTSMNWADANSWVAGLTVEGVTGWRLPGTLQPDASCDSQSAGVSFGYNCTGSEMGNLFYNLLGNTAAAGFTSHSSGPFSNIQNDSYWSFTEDALNTSRAWNFSMSGGGQSWTSKVNSLKVWAVHDGDISAVPVPAAIWLFGSGLIGLAGIARRKKA